MSTQLDILALEPFFGGARRHMLETVIRCSRHRWTLLKLPPRRMERRLSVAANWFSEQLSRHWSGRSDILFTSEAMNLGSLYRLVPDIARQPSVVYFHDNQLLSSQSQTARQNRATTPQYASYSGTLSDMYHDNKSSATVEPPHDVDMQLVNLNTATTATEIWFNSTFHLQSFMVAAARVVERHPELSSRNPMADVRGKAHLMPPPIDLNLVPHVKEARPNITRDPRAIFVDTRDGQLRVLNAALAELASRGEKFRLITVGPVEDLSDHWPRRTISETDDFGHVQGLLECGVVLSVRPNAACDLQVIRGLQSGCRPVLPDRGFYADLIPHLVRDMCLYSFNMDTLANALQEAINPTLSWPAPNFWSNLKPYEAIAATKVFDERLSHLALAHAVE